MGANSLKDLFITIKAGGWGYREIRFSPVPLRVRYLHRDGDDVLVFGDRSSQLEKPYRYDIAGGVDLFSK